jgi:SAM-dependent methyltransferase
MNLPDYEYWGLMVQAWDVLRGDTSQWSDRPFYLEVIRRYGQPVLDVGCGTGRLLLDYLQHGIDVDGVDNSPEMLALCRQKAADLGLSPHLFQQYMETLDLPRRYATILIPSSSLQLIVDPRLVAQALRRLRNHLLPRGAIVASIMTLWRKGDPLESEWEQTATREEDGVEFRRFSKSRYDLLSECEDTEDLYQMLVDGRVVAEEVHRRSPATRSYTQTQARALFEDAGFVDVQLFSEFTFDPVKPDDTLFVVIGRKSPSPQQPTHSDVLSDPMLVYVGRPADTCPQSHRLQARVSCTIAPGGFIAGAGGGPTQSYSTAPGSPPAPTEAETPAGAG